jgi:hypothetical protein
MTEYKPRKWYDHFERDYMVPWPSSGQRRWVYVCVGYDENKNKRDEQAEKRSSSPKDDRRDEELRTLQREVDRRHLKNEKIEQELERKHLKKEQREYVKEN